MFPGNICVHPVYENRGDCLTKGSGHNDVRSVRHHVGDRTIDGDIQLHRSDGHRPSQHAWIKRRLAILPNGESVLTRRAGPLPNVAETHRALNDHRVGRTALHKCPHALGGEHTIGDGDTHHVVEQRAVHARFAYHLITTEAEALTVRG